MLGGAALELELQSSSIVVSAQVAPRFIYHTNTAQRRLIQTLNITAISGYSLAIAVKDTKGTSNA